MLDSDVLSAFKLCTILCSVSV